MVPEDVQERSIEDVFADEEAITGALKKAVRAALIEHKKLGHPIVVWENGKIVWIPPEEIEVDGVKPEDGK